jgi:hypothetical protein
MIINNMKYLTLAAALLLVSCGHDPISSEHIGANDEIRVDFLFEKDGIKVYRFSDAGHTHYFTTGGTTMSTYTSGKQTYTEEIPRHEAHLPTDNN